MTASSNISPAFTKKKSKKNKDNFVKIEFEVHNDLKLLPTFMVNYGYPYNDIVICKDSTDYLGNRILLLYVSCWRSG